MLPEILTETLMGMYQVLFCKNTESTAVKLGQIFNESILTVFDKGLTFFFAKLGKLREQLKENSYQDLFVLKHTKYRSSSPQMA